MEREHQIDIRNTAHFRHFYDSEQPDMRRLYEQAKIDQWNAATDIDWEQPLEGDGGLIADDLVDIHGTKFWDRLSDAQRVELNRCVSRWRISTLMAGEHGAMLVCSQLVENVVGQDAKLFQATQVVDEARHNEVLQRYVTLRLDGETYPLAGNVREIFDTLLGTSAWYLRRLGCNWSPRPSRCHCSECSPNRRRTKSCARYAGGSCRMKHAIWASACCRCRRWWQRRPRQSAGKWRISLCGP